MLAVECQRNSQGNRDSVLTSACPFPTMTQTSTDLRTGRALTEIVPGGPADWRNSERMADPQAATGDTLAVLKEQRVTADWDPGNQQGMYMEAVREPLRRR